MRVIQHIFLIFLKKYGCETQKTYFLYLLFFAEMVRISNWYARHKKHKKYIKAAKGFRLWRKNVYTQVRRALVKQGQNAYIGRKNKKRIFRRLWIERLSAAVRSKWWKYSVFAWSLRAADIQLDRKVLSNIAILFPEVFDKIYEEASV